MLLSLSISTYAQLNQLLHTHIKLKEQSVDTINFKIDSILIVGAGPSVSRIFMNEFSSKISSSLQSSKIHIGYYYLGNNIQAATSNYKSIDKKGYKVVLLMHPIDTAQFGTLYKGRMTIFETRWGDISHVHTNSRTVLRQNFLLKAFRPDNETSFFWTAIADIDCDPGKPAGADLLSNKVLHYFRANKYID